MNSVNRMIMMCSVLFGMVFFLTSPSWCGTEGTVLSVIGEALIKKGTETTWTPIKKGDSVQEGNVLKTGAKSLIRILAPDGTMIKIPEENETAVNFAQKKQSGGDEGNMSTFVAEFFSPNQRTRINAVRSLIDPLQQDWIAFCNFDRLEPDKIEMGLELSAAYQHEKVENRSAFILWKLHDLFPDNAGLKSLASQSINSNPNTGRWEIFGSLKEGEKSIENSASLRPGDAVTVRYRNSKESYVYLYMSSKSPDGTVKTEQIFPKTADVMALSDDLSASDRGSIRGISGGKSSDLNFSARIAPEETLFAKEDKVSVTKNPEPFSDEVINLKKGQIVEVLEEKGRRYHVKLDNDIKGWVLKHKLTSENPASGTKSGDLLLVMTADEKMEPTYIWGWSSPGPLSHRHIYKAVSEIENFIASSDAGLDVSFLKKSLPEICGAFTVVKLLGQ